MFCKVALAIFVNIAVVTAQIKSRYSPSNLADQCSALRQAADALCGNVIASCPIPPKNCTEVLNFDFLYIMDESGSIESFNQNGFEKQKQFLKEFTSKYTIGSGPTDSRAGLIAFGTVANVEFLPGQFNTNDEINAQIDAVQYSSGNTNIRDALLQAADVATLPSIRRAGVPLVVLLLTDGKSNIGTSAELNAAAEQLRSIDEVELFAIGIKTLSDDGNSSPTYDKDELLNIVGDDDSHFFEVDSFNDLALSGDLTAHDVCECVLAKKDGKTTTASEPSSTVTLTSVFTGSVTTATSPTTNASTMASSTSISSEATTMASSTPISSEATTMASSTPISSEATTMASSTPISSEATTMASSTPISSEATTIASSTPISSEATTMASSPNTTTNAPEATSSVADATTTEVLTSTGTDTQSTDEAESTTRQSSTVIFRTQEPVTESITEESSLSTTQSQGTPIIVTQGSTAATLGQ